VAVAVTRVGLVEMARDPVVRMVPMRHRGMAACRAVRVARSVRGAVVALRACVWIGLGDHEAVVVHVVAVGVMQVAVVQRVLVAIMQDLLMPATGAVLVRMGGMGLAIHGPQNAIGLQMP
jgi:hypothetical protein